jgi:hypothetical protein
VLIGARVTADSAFVVVVAVSLPVAQDDRTRAHAAITGINRISFFIFDFEANKLDSTEVAPEDGLGKKFLKPARSEPRAPWSLKDGSRKRSAPAAARSSTFGFTRSMRPGF